MNITSAPATTHPIPTKKEPPTNFQVSQKTILNLLNNPGGPTLLPQVHALSLKSGYFNDHYVSGTLVKSYAQTNLDLAFKVFDSISAPNVFVYNVLIGVSLDKGEPWKSVESYFKMVASYGRPNKYIFPKLLKACGAVKGVEEGVQVHSHLVKFGLSRDFHVKSSGILMYIGFGDLDGARRLLEQDDGMFDAVCCNAMLDGYLKFGNLEAAKELFGRMEEKNVGSWNVMISGLARGGFVGEARELFDQMKKRDEISWSAMIDGYVKDGNYKEALHVFNLMQTQNLRPRAYVLSSVLAACANIGALDHGRWIHAYVDRSSIYVDAVLGTALVDMYAKCGRLDLAWDVFEKMKDKRVFTWNAMICGLAMNGRAEDAVHLFYQMQRNKFRPNGITFVGVLNACSHAGMVDRGLKLLDSMKNKYGIEPGMEHYGCVVDLLGRAGLLRKAEEFIDSMPIQPGAAVYGALLGACRIYGDVEIGERVGKILLDMEPENSGRYALLSNIYADAKRWEDATNVRKLMKERGVKTTPGSSMIELGGTVHEFKTAEGSHPQIAGIYAMLQNMIERIEMEGYTPNTSHVTFDIEEGEKETALQYHSEKLAMAFGLINTKEGTSLRIVKNLRICNDCHAAAKLISRVYGRDIIVRDRVRYHHFRNGECSCKDFW